METMLIKDYAKKRGIGKEYIRRLCQANRANELPGVTNAVKLPGFIPSQDYWQLTVNVSEIPTNDTL